MILGIINTLLLWVVTSLTFICIGKNICKISFYNKNPKSNNYHNFWLGWASSLILLQIYHLFFAINKYTAISLLTIGLICLAFSAKSLIREAKLFFLSNKSLLIAFFIFSIWLANRTMGSIATLGNAGLYHLTTIKWITTHPIIPGLGKLSTLFAYNQSHFLYLSIIEKLKWFVMPNNPGNALLLLVISFHLLSSLINIFRKNSKNIYLDFVKILFIPTIIYKCYIYAPSYTPDLALFIIGIIIFLKFAKIFLTTSKDTNDLMLIIVLALVGVTIKLSFIFYASIAICISILYLIFVMNTNKPRLLLVIVLLFSLITGTWAIRSIILTGYPIFPSKLLSVNTDWKIPNKTLATAKLVREWQYYYEIDLTEKIPGYFAWLKYFAWYWAIKRKRFDIILLPLLLIAYSTYLFLNWKKNKNHNILKESLITVPAWISVISLFFYAPSPRFMGSAPFQIWFGSLIIFAKQNNLLRNHRRKAATIYLATIILIFCKTSFLAKPGPSNRIYPIPNPKYKKVKINSYLNINIPENNKLCWNIPLPCAYKIQPGLSLRKNNDIKFGFKIKKEK
jgi:hypothetical protein